MTLSTGPWWCAPVLALGWITTVPAQSFSAPARAWVIAAARFMPGVCAVLMSSSFAWTTRTPWNFQFDSADSAMFDSSRNDPGIILSNDHAPTPRLARQHGIADRGCLPDALDQGRGFHDRAGRSARARPRQHDHPADPRAAYAAGHAPHAWLVHSRDQRAAVLVRRLVRQGLRRRGVLGRLPRRDHLQPDLLAAREPGAEV